MNIQDHKGRNEYPSKVSLSLCSFLFGCGYFLNVRSCCSVPTLVVKAYPLLTVRIDVQRSRGCCSFFGFRLFVVGGMRNEYPLVMLKLSLLQWKAKKKKAKACTYRYAPYFLHFGTSFCSSRGVADNFVQECELKVGVMNIVNEQEQQQQTHFVSTVEQK